MMIFMHMLIIKKQEKNCLVISNFAKQTKKNFKFTWISAKAGKLATGFDAVKISLSKNQAKLIFIGNDVSQNTKDKLNFLIRKKKMSN